MSQLKLPLLAPHDDALQKCVYCPKLSRAACPVSNVEANETVTPWGKMSLAYFSARGDVPLDAEHAESAWACSACYACRERCEHKNEVATVLNDARAEYFAARAAPAAAVKVAEGFAARQRAHQDAVRRLAEEMGLPLARPGSRRVLLVGCSYALEASSEARAIARVASRLVRGLELCAACCGLPLYYAGDRPGFVAAAEALGRLTEHAERLLVADPGCARCLAVEHRVLGATRRGAAQAARPRVEPLIDVVYAELSRLPPKALGGRRLRYHDPCQLGRGLGRYEEPRAVLARLTGEAPAELARNRAAAECSGGGGLLPVTRPASSRAIADARIAEHRELGGGTLVTACAESLRRFRGSGEQAVDLMSLVDEALITLP